MEGTGENGQAPPPRGPNIIGVGENSGKQFPPLGIETLSSTLGLTIKEDNVNKVITFLAMLSAYTENSQLNISFSAPSSAGKSYIAMEIAKLFPGEDIKEISYCSPTSFYHQIGTYDKNKGGYVIDFRRQIIIFQDQPHYEVVARLRSLLSHDAKELLSQITDKNEKGGHRTKLIFMKGFPVIIFCTAGTRMSEQESTRFIVLSPELNEAKIRKAVEERIKKETNEEDYQTMLLQNEERQQLILRIQAIREQRISEVIVGNPDLVSKLFLASREDHLKSRHTRDVGRLISLVKSLALLNCFHRERKGRAIIANDRDAFVASELFESISESQELNLAPYLLDVFKIVILPLWKERMDQLSNHPVQTFVGLARKEVMDRYRLVFRKPLPEPTLRQDILPELEAAGLITQVRDLSDSRKYLIVVTR
jgi:hypothetical protein